MTVTQQRRLSDAGPFTRFLGRLKDNHILKPADLVIAVDHIICNHASGLLHRKCASDWDTFRYAETKTYVICSVVQNIRITCALCRHTTISFNS